jgi:hypothetical protein
MSWNTLSSKILTKLQTVSKLDSCYEYPTEKFDGYPAATITPSEETADFETTSENKRYYAFKIRVFQDIPAAAVSGEVPIKYAFRILKGCIDDIIDAFDKDPTLTGISMPTGYTFLYLYSSPSSWGLVTQEDKRIIFAEIDIKALVSFDINS